MYSHDASPCRNPAIEQVLHQLIPSNRCARHHANNIRLEVVQMSCRFSGGLKPWHGPKLLRVPSCEVTSAGKHQIHSAKLHDADGRLQISHSIVVTDFGVLFEYNTVGVVTSNV